MKFKLLFILLISLSTLCLAQNQIFKGEKSYPATGSWGFETQASVSDPRLNVTVAKASSKTGYLMLSMEVPFSVYHIGPSVLLYLENGKVLTISTRTSSDNVDGESIVLFSLNSTQINALKVSTIDRIRFSISIAGNNKENYTARNVGLKSKSSFDLIDLGVQQTTITPYRTSDQITLLFEE